jgi:hypothetical protein
VDFGFKVVSKSAGIYQFGHTDEDIANIESSRRDFDPILDKLSAAPVSLIRY